MRVLLLNAGSSSLKCTLLESDHNDVVGRASADWAGRMTRYESVGPRGERTSEEVAWRGHAETLSHALGDLGLAPLRPGAR